MTKMRCSGLVALVVAFLAIASPAQLLPCPFGGIDDGFDVGCCNTPNPLLPQFPGFQMNAVYACINNCNVANPLQASVSVAPPNYFFCDYAISNVTINFAGGIVMAGPLLMKYSTTWQEFGLAAVPRQVWRFLVNGDLNAAATAAGVGCPIPPCAAPPLNLPVHFVGHIDYACDPTSTVGFLAAISLTHLPGCLSHAPFSDRPLAGAAAHTNVSYHLVGPAPFVFGAVPEPQGPAIAESVRESRLFWTPFVYACISEAPIQQAQIQTQTTNCLCSPILPIIGPWKHQNIQGATCCAGIINPFSNIPLPGTPLPTGFAAHTIGRYTGPAGSFPGTRSLSVYIGLLQYVVPCSPATSFPFHVVTGVATSGVTSLPFTNPATLCGPIIAPVATQVVSLQNQLLLSTIATSGSALPGLGSFSASALVFNLFLP